MFSFESGNGNTRGRGACGARAWDGAQVPRRGHMRISRSMHGNEPMTYNCRCACPSRTRSCGQRGQCPRRSLDPTADLAQPRTASLLYTPTRPMERGYGYNTGGSATSCVCTSREGYCSPLEAAGLGCLQDGTALGDRRFSINAFCNCIAHKSNFQNRFCS